MWYTSAVHHTYNIENSKNRFDICRRVFIDINNVDRAWAALPRLGTKILWYCLRYASTGVGYQMAYRYEPPLPINSSFDQLSTHSHIIRVYRSSKFRPVFRKFKLKSIKYITRTATSNVTSCGQLRDSNIVYKLVGCSGADGMSNDDRTVYLPIRSQTFGSNIYVIFSCLVHARIILLFYLRIYQYYAYIIYIRYYDYGCQRGLTIYIYIHIHA